MLDWLVKGMCETKAYACYYNDKNVRLHSSSGAVFTALAELVIQNHGVVYGVAMAEDCYSAEFISVEDIESLSKLRGSKYVQAKVGNSFKKVKEDLLSNKTVLFTGTACQINGLLKFLGKEYENLICVDVVCHGVPSPDLWQAYAKFMEQTNNSKLKNFYFRAKDYGWSNFGIKGIFNKNSLQEEKEVYVSKKQDPYMQMFLRDYCLRPSCYECIVKTQKMSDITIADFWGIYNVAPELDDEIGTSLLIIRTPKGKHVFERICDKLNFKEVDYYVAVKANPAEFKSSTKPKQREVFFTDLQNLSFEEMCNKYAKPKKTSLVEKVVAKLKTVIKTMLRFIRK